MSAHRQPAFDESAEPLCWGLNLRVRFSPSETEEEALREKDNIIEHLQRIGYDVEPMGLNYV